jgi:uncharacterized protein YprB with RNaseH-like and TPR domain
VIADVAMPTPDERDAPPAGSGPLPDAGHAGGAPTHDLDGLRSRLRKSQQQRRSGLAARRAVPPGGSTPGRVPGDVQAGPGPPATSTGTPAPARGGADRVPVFAGRHVALEAEAGGVEASTQTGGTYYLVERRPCRQDAAFAWLDGSVREALSRGGTALAAELERAGTPVPLDADRIVCFDLETTGLGSSPLFLIGTLTFDGNGPLVRQLFARDYTEERAVLEAFLAIAEGRELAVSFNGKSFDVPFIKMRAAYNALACGLAGAHLDLLHAARRRWKDVLPDCRLQTLEQHVCLRARRGDIPGAMIPEAYHEYVRSTNAARMVEVLRHNYLDLMTLIEVMARMARCE